MRIAQEATQKKIEDMTPAEIFHSPAFVVVYGKVVYHQGGFRGTLTQGQELSYRKHGRFIPEYVGKDYAVIHHVTVYGKVMKIFIPQKKMATISNGAYQIEDLWSYESYERYERYYSNK